MKLMRINGLGELEARERLLDRASQKKLAPKVCKRRD
jgi:hypothetical protein